VSETEPGRRSLLAMLAAFAALALLVVAVSLAAGVLKGAPSSDASAVRLTPEAAAFLGPLATGSRFGAWRIARIDPSPPSRLTLELESERGERFVVDVHARSPDAPPGVAETAQLAIYVRSDKRGAPTPEAAVYASTELATALRAREESGHAPPALESLPPLPR
jgi:hypothetical protein